MNKVLGYKKKKKNSSNSLQLGNLHIHMEGRIVFQATFNKLMMMLNGWWNENYAEYIFMKFEGFEKTK